MKIKKYKINDKEYTFISNALVPIKFHNEFGKDIFNEIDNISEYLNTQQRINKSLKKQEENGEVVEYVDENLKPEQQETLVQLAYILNKNGEKFELSFDEWLENLNLVGFAIMQNIATEIWIEENETNVEAKKK